VLAESSSRTFRVGFTYTQFDASHGGHEQRLHGKDVLVFDERWDPGRFEAHLCEMGLAGGVKGGHGDQSPHGAFRLSYHG
jgi:hypothetical protein